MIVSFLFFMLASAENIFWNTWYSRIGNSYHLWGVLVLIWNIFVNKFGRLCLCYSNRADQCMDSDFSVLCNPYLKILFSVILWVAHSCTVFGQDMKRWCLRCSMEWNILKHSIFFFFFSCAGIFVWNWSCWFFLLKFLFRMPWLRFLFLLNEKKNLQRF